MSISLTGAVSSSFERAAASLLGELAHRDERHQQDQLDGRLEEDVHQGRLLG